jgi:hypothetical protein
VPGKRTDYYYCAQNDKEAAPSLDYDDPERRRRRRAMDRFDCGGYLDITSNAANLDEITIRLYHTEQHVPYCDIYIPEDLRKEIDSRPNDKPSEIWSDILEKDPCTQLTQKQVYARWTLANASNWKLDPDQVVSSRMLIEQWKGGEKMQLIDLKEETGISSIAFAFEDVLRRHGSNIEEIAMDSTCKCWFARHQGDT